MARDINVLHPTLQKLIAQLKIKCKNQGLIIGIGECYRTVAEQDALYAKGRTTVGNIVTNAKGSSYSSMHQWRIAVDFYRNDGKGAYNNSDKFFNRVGKIGQSLGLEWGGSWTSPVDLPHFQLPDWGSTPSKLKKMYGTPDNFKASWVAISEIKEEIIKENAEDEEEMIKYNYTQEVPEWAKPTIQKLLDKKYLTGDDKGKLGLNDTMLKVFVINDRAGLYN
ncbi:MAG: M15 family metallopeptidase [Burkholderiales bacterium]|nr:M15 family metallopeptidase [Burkholderiales bacterium]